MTKRIIPLFANDVDGVYGDISHVIEDILNDHPGEAIIYGYGILDDETGYLAEGTEDFYFTEDEALEALEDFKAK